MEDNDTSNTKVQEAIILLEGIRNLIGSCIVLTILCTIAIKGKLITKVATIPFLICCITMFINGIVLLICRLQIKRKKYPIEVAQKMEYIIYQANKWSMKIYVIGFFIFWFGFLIVVDGFILMNWSNGNWQMFLFSILFWVIGIKMLKKQWKKLI